MAIKRFSSRKNFVLYVVFLILLAASMVAALSIAYNFTSRYIYTEFEKNKTEVVDETMKPYNDFFQNKIGEISLYQGYLDTNSAEKFSKSIFASYPFVNKIVFYDTEVSNHRIDYAFSVRSLSIAPRTIVQFGRNLSKDSVLVFDSSLSASRPVTYINEFNRLAAKFSAYLQGVEQGGNPEAEDELSTFYNITPNRVSFMNVPREQEIQAFRKLMDRDTEKSPVYQQDILSFKLDPYKLNIKNIHPYFYEKIAVVPLTSVMLDVDSVMVSTEFPLSGAFASYKMYFSSSPEFLSKEISRRYLPLAAAILLVYGLLILMGVLIYRNLSINNKLFKLQYDFVNNLTHEFKTPVSVIKIAGNNIRRAKQLGDTERVHYGKILDEEADKLNDLMNKLLSFTQIENQAIKLKLENINLEVFVQNLIDAYQIKYPDFTITYSVEGIDYFYSDPVLLGSLFQNLIDNAYKYSLPGKKELDIRVVLEKTDIVFRFTDRGIGIPKNEEKNIFKKFYRIQSEFNQQGSVGLGLAFCKELVNFMQGDISVKSKPGQGSQFIITLPYNKMI